MREPAEGKPQRFSEQTFAVPFGRYQPGSDVGPPANEVLVGREGQRAYFIDLLFRMGRRGAFLITGHRGVGKTSFVNYCVEQYRGEVYERFLHSNVGRVTFWDRGAVTLLGLLFVFLLLMLSELIEILSLPLKQDHSGKVFPLLCLIPLVIVGLYPLLYAREAWRRIFEVHRQKRPRLSSHLMSLGTMAILIVLILLTPLFRAIPAVSMSRFLVLIAVFYLWVQATSFNPIQKASTPQEEKESEERSRRTSWIWNLATAVVLGLVLLNFGFAPLAPPAPSGPNVPHAEVFINLGWGALIFGFGSLLRGSHLRGFPEPIREGAPDEPIPSPHRWYGLIGGTVLFIGIGILLATPEANNPHILAPLLVGLAATLVFLLVRRWHRRPPTPPGLPSFRPRPLVALSIKAVLSTIVSLQILHAFIVRFMALLHVKGFLPTSGMWAYFQKPLTESEHLFHGKIHEVLWVASVFLSLAVLYYMEYEWVIRPFVRERLDDTLDHSAPPRWKDQDATGFSESLRESIHKSLANLTLPWLLYKTWLPVLVISVNLGFEKLEHRPVVHAMLAGLRERYQRALLSWRSPLANLGRLLAVLGLFLLVNLIGNHWFELPPIDKQAVARMGPDYRRICWSFKGDQKGPGIVNLVCKTKWGSSIFHGLYFNLLEGENSHAADPEHLIYSVFLPYRRQPWPAEAETPLLQQGIHFEVYHVLLFLTLLLFSRWILRRVPLLAYQSTLKRIDEVLDHLSARTSVTSRVGRLEPIEVLQGLFVDEKVRHIEQDPGDPRTVEFLFLQILSDMQRATVHLAGARDQLISLPTPEIIFVFDELDKLGTRVDPGEGESSGGSQQVEILHSERKRSMELHKLLADMKNLLSSAPARFVFIGGRNLHDEWLADQTARQPLLTNLFSAEVYIPSLVTDFGRVASDKRTLDRNIKVYLKSQMQRAAKLFRMSQKRTTIPSLALPLEDQADESFLSPPKEDKQLWNLGLTELGSDDVLLKHLLWRDFRQFLTYRSMGNPKRLKELLGTFVRPVSRVVKDDRRRWGKLFKDCDHVLAFGDTERFRVQLLARMYRHLTLTFESLLVRRDDKLAISVFYLADFLFKFHRRAFSWSNLERADELVHIHRAPDLREILEAMVMQWSERFLHPIRNGMYDFRFRSDLAREVEYISRQSHEEMAAFNFTLDESQALKSTYQTNIALFKEKTGREPVDMVAGLGELHEFDQEYEEARVYYRRAITLLDQDLIDVVGRGGPEGHIPPVRDILAVEPEGLKHARLYLTWGIARLRLMLQIGMTFEQSLNLERAGVEYRNAHTLARALFNALLPASQEPETEKEKKKDELVDSLHPLKHLNILFQPSFAEAWVAEKLAGAVDTSTSLIEKELWFLRRRLHFVSDPVIDLSTSPIHIRGSNFGLIMAELHNKAGDLYFFKGRQRVTKGDLGEMGARIEEPDRSDPRHGLEGYLLRAHYHYAVGLHELRRLMTHRRYSSTYKLNIWSEDAFGEQGLWPTISRESWPDFVFRSAGGTLNDIGEAMLGRVSLYGLLTGLKQPQLKPLRDEWRDLRTAKDTLVRSFILWLESASYRDRDGVIKGGMRSVPIQIPLAGRGLPAGTLESWMGDWRAGEKYDNEPATLRLIEFRDPAGHDDVERLCVSLQLKLVGTKFLEKGGYIEDAAHELLGVCEIVSQYLWWLLAIRKLVSWSEQQEELQDPILTDAIKEAHNQAQFKNVLLDYLLDVALYALNKADKLFRRGRRAEQEEAPDSAQGEGGPGEDGEPYLVGNKIPVAALVLACSLGISASHWSLGRRAVPGIEDLLASWGVDLEHDHPKALRHVLRQCLVRHSYPMIHRVHGLKILIDDQILSDCECDSVEISERIKELLQLAASLDAPMHFTPLHSGITCALAYFRLSLAQCSGSREERDREIIRRAAQRDLSSSEEMFTLRRSYYENISHLFYLYDDFNDRQIHISHAIQMAGAELNALLMYLVTRRDYMDQPGEPLASPSEGVSASLRLLFRAFGLGSDGAD